MRKSKGRIAFVVQRFGKEVCGGAETLAYDLAKRASKHYDIEVITTKAIDQYSWRDYYVDDVEIVNGVIVRRFSVDKPRDMKVFMEVEKEVNDYGFNNLSTRAQMDFLKLQGPYSSAMFFFIKNGENDYDLFIFFTYVFVTCAYGSSLVARKSVLLPTAHDESAIYRNIYKKMFEKAGGIIYLTAEERELVERLFPKTRKKISTILGAGVDPKGKVAGKISKKINQAVRGKKYGLYIGRIEPSKGVIPLFDYFEKYSRKGRNIYLYLIGSEVVAVPKHNRFKYLGFVSEEEKCFLIKNCEFLINPSPAESLSIVLLEAWQQGKAVLVNGNCRVMVGQCQRSNGGLWYSNYEEFESCVDRLLDNTEEREIMGKNGQNFVAENYTWQTVEKRFDDFIKQRLGLVR